MTEFLSRNGVTALASVIQTNGGNTLAYGLNAMQLILDLDHGWNDLSTDFVARVRFLRL